MLPLHLKRALASPDQFHVAYLTTEPLGQVGLSANLHQRQDSNIHVLEWDAGANTYLATNAVTQAGRVTNLPAFLESRRALWLTLASGTQGNQEETIVHSQSVSAYLDQNHSQQWSRRLWLVAALLAVIVVALLGYKWYTQPPLTLPQPIIFRKA